MTRKQSLIFWLSALCGIAGAASGYSLLGGELPWAIDPAGADLSSTSAADLPPESDSSAPGAETRFPWRGHLSKVSEQVWLGMGLLGLVGFWTAWHGSAVSLTGGTPISGALAGVIAAVFIWAALAAVPPAFYWFLERPFPEALVDLGKYSLLTGLLAWQLGFWCARPWASSEGAIAVT